MFDVVAKLGKGGQGVIANGLAASKAELAEEASTPTGYVFDNDAFDVDLDSKRSTYCQLEPSSASTFHARETCAHRHKETTSKWLKILKSNSLGNLRLIRASSFSLNTLPSRHTCPLAAPLRMELEAWTQLVTSGL